jgi:DNA-binding winged helix-turn-helix (wHTH) protein/tetratricopeptide (TPR) repeat protein
MAADIFTFGDVTFDAAERRLTRQGRTSSLTAKANGVLATLVRAGGRLVSKRALLDQVWPDANVEEGIVSVYVSGLRKALGDSHPPTFIETVSGAGYRFIAPIATDAVALFMPMNGNRQTDPSIHELIGRGRFHLFSMSLHEIDRAVAAFEAAVVMDPSYAAAHAGLALAHCAQAELRVVPPADAYARAKRAALRALALDDRSADAQAALGAVLFLSEWDWAGARRSLERAIQIDANHTEAYLLYGRLLEALGMLGEGLQAKKRALERNPFSPAVHLQISLSYWNQRRYEQSIAWANRTLDLDPEHLMAREHLAGAYWKLGDFDRHMAENIRHARAYGVAPEALQPIKDAYASGGRPAVVRFALAAARERHQKFPAVQLALLHGEVGEFDAAFEHLDSAIDRQDPCLVHLAVAPQWDCLRGDARFAACLRRMSLGSDPGLTLV